MKFILKFVFIVLFAMSFALKSYAQGSISPEALKLLKVNTTTEMLAAREVATVKLPSLQANVDAIQLKLKATDITPDQKQALQTQLETAKAEQIAYNRIAKNRTPKEQIETLEKQLLTGKMSENQKAGIKVRIDTLKNLDK
jgi:hypothetical protein